MTVVKWEYHVRKIGYSDNPEDFLNALGQNGWELVAVSSDAGGDVRKLFLKRPIIEG